ncbi:uncharacterized protein N7511_010622, partial [Penicillium nucicola]|uniref:uncharacterized protein n=1 Tax=Penicillium nucicola TaxID=1850975 RepID=UPI002544E5B7
MDFTALHQLQSPGIVFILFSSLHFFSCHSVIFIFIYWNVGKLNIEPRHVRPTRHRIAHRHRNNNQHNDNENEHNDDDISGDEYGGNILPFPKGIDHEVPRWSAAFSMFSEMRRLLAPLSPESEGESDESQDINVMEGEMEEMGMRTKGMLRLGLDLGLGL